MTKEIKSNDKHVMLESKSRGKEDEIDLLQLIRILLQEWKIISAITLACALFAIAYALYTPEIFKAETLLAPANEEKTSTSSALSQFGGLAAMAGISIPSDSNVEQVVATLQSRKFLLHFVEKNNLTPILFEEIWDSETQEWLTEKKEKPSNLKVIDTFKSNLAIDVDKKSGLIKMSYSWKDPKIAAKWVNDLVKQLNEELREKAITDSNMRVGYLEQELTKTSLKDMRSVLYNLLESEKQKAMLANVNKDFALEVIDPAVIPEIRQKPKRKLIVIIGSICGGFLGVFTIFFRQFLLNVKSSLLLKEENL